MKRYLVPGLFALLLSLTSCNDDATAPVNNQASPLKGTILFAPNISSYSIAKLDLATGTVSSFGEGHSPSHSVAHTIVAVHSVESDLIEYDESGQGRRVIVAGVTAQQQDQYDAAAFQNPQVSPDGKYVAYAGGPGSRAVYVVDRLSGALVSSYYSANNDYYSPSWISNARLAMIGRAPGDDTHLYTAAFPAGTPQKLENSYPGISHAKASPDGNWIAFDFNSHIYLIGTDGTGATQLTESQNAESFPDWSPDSKWVLAFAYNDLIAVPIGAGTVQHLPSLYPQLDQRTYYTSQTTWY